MLQAASRSCLAARCNYNQQGVVIQDKTLRGSNNFLALRHICTDRPRTTLQLRLPPLTPYLRLKSRFRYEYSSPASPAHNDESPGSVHISQSDDQEDRREEPNQTQAPSDDNLFSDFSLRHMMVFDVPPSVMKAREFTLQRVQEALSRRFSKSYRAALFGGTVYGVSTPKSDLDIVILDAGREFGRRVSKKAADLPMKFHDPETNLECDINVNDLHGVYNTALLKRYCDATPLLRPMLAFIKLWAKPLGLNDPAQDGSIVTFSSYHYALMTIALLQKEGSLPRLQQDLPPLSMKKGPTRGCFELDGKLIDGRCREVSSEWKPRIEMKLDAALIMWFRFWAHEYDYREQVIDPVIGKIDVPFADKRFTIKSPVQLRDVFTGKNLTRNIGRSATRVFREDCAEFLQLIEDDKRTRQLVEAVWGRLERRFIWRDAATTTDEDFEGPIDTKLFRWRKPLRNPKLR
ncbi:poly polymerase cid13 [Moniliophthora roreri MCA 2997]|uniref:Poly polymerase cid13 n=1 Tax=Moniliophthora roreri (strain MCA 2997) TaxID=1381753 RepID=V2WPD9_MONRO|nr:poly polymerase cid13 [Moniliophthora roreri MCA 2997]